MRATAFEGASVLRRVALAFGLVALLLVALPAAAGAASGWRVLAYEGEQFSVPATWPVYHLAGTSTCARFNRHAVYEGAASGAGSCAPGAVGVAAALEVEPLVDLRSLEVADALRPTTIGSEEALVSSTTAVTHREIAVFPRAGIEAIVSYRTDAPLAERILESFRPTGVAPAPTDRAVPMVPLEHTALSAASAETATAQPLVFEGEGFDTCDAPSPAEMATWRADSPFGAAGVYIGGANAACTNITSTWVDEETATGWDLFPLYVGLQAPCVDQSGLATMSSTPATAEKQGTEEAENAVEEAEGFGFPAGSTLYFDMEAWNVSSSSCNEAVLDFITGWTSELHSGGFKSGMYGSLLAGVASPGVAALYGTAGAPDAIDFAAWDGDATTTTSYLPSSDWPDGRIKQFEGNTEVSYGHVAIDVDLDELDGPAVGVPTTVSEHPTLASIEPSTAPVGVKVTVTGTGFVAGKTSVAFGSESSTAVHVLSADELTALVPPETTPDAVVTITTPFGSSATGDAPTSFSYSPFVGLAADTATGGYYFVSASGAVENFAAPFYGSVAGKRLPAPIVAMATTRTGYLLVTAKGNVYNFHTPWYGSASGRRLPAPVVGITATKTGYLLVTAKGNVYNFHTPWYGSRANKRLPAPVVGIAATANGGYLVTTRRGNVYNYGTAFFGSTVRATLPAPVVAISCTEKGYLLVTANGEVYSFHTPDYGSATPSSASDVIVGAASTSSGYVLGDSSGVVYTFHTPSEGSPSSRG